MLHNELVGQLRH